MTFNLFFKDLLILCVWVFCLYIYIYVYHVCVWCLSVSEVVSNLLKLVTGNGELPCGYLELYLGPVKEQRP